MGQCNHQRAEAIVCTDLGIKAHDPQIAHESPLVLRPLPKYITLNSADLSEDVKLGDLRTLNQTRVQTVGRHVS